MRSDVQQVVGIAPNLEIETPRAIYPSLPDGPAFIIFFGA
jgi:hypothetical protein